MKRITQIRHNDMPIKRIYLNNEIIYDRSLVKVIVTGKSAIEEILAAVPEAVLGSSVSAQSLFDVEAQASTEAAQIIDIDLKSIFQLNSIADGIAVLPSDSAGLSEIKTSNIATPEYGNITLVRLKDKNNLFAKAAPTDDVAIVNGESQISVQSKGVAVDAPARNMSAFDKMHINTIADGHAIRLAYAYGHSQIAIDECSSAKTSLVEYANAHDKISARAQANGSDAVMVDATMHSKINITSRLSADETYPVYGAGHSEIGLDVYFTADTTEPTSVGAVGDVSLDTIATTDYLTMINAYAHSDVIATTNLANAMLWQYPKDMGDYWLIVQAYDTNKTNNELEVI